MTLYPVSISEARDSAGRFNMSAFVTSVHTDIEARPGKDYKLIFYCVTECSVYYSLKE